MQQQQFQPFSPAGPTPNLNFSRTSGAIVYSEIDWPTNLNELLAWEHHHENQTMLMKQSQTKDEEAGRSKACTNVKDLITF